MRNFEKLARNMNEEEDYYLRCIEFFFRSMDPACLLGVQLELRREKKSGVNEKGPDKS